MKLVLQSRFNTWKIKCGVIWQGYWGVIKTADLNYYSWIITSFDLWENDSPSFSYCFFILCFSLIFLSDHLSAKIFLNLSSKYCSKQNKNLILDRVFWKSIKINYTKWHDIWNLFHFLMVCILWREYRSFHFFTEKNFEPFFW